MITTLLFDVGGVLLTNGWDHLARARAVRRFGLDAVEFDRRHRQVVDAFERGGIDLDEYLQRTVFHRPRAFGPGAFRQFVLAQSEPHDDALAFARELAAAGRYRMVTVNNESLDVNLHRIQRYGLAQTFSLFCSSCFLGLAKPDPEIWRKALQLTQRQPAECLFVDDREDNVRAARTTGIRAVRYTGVAALRRAIAAPDDG